MQAEGLMSVEAGKGGGLGAQSGAAGVCVCER